MAVETFDVTRNSARKALFEKYSSQIEINTNLSRSLVSYQSNQKRPYYRWFKYKEGFSAALVEYVLTDVKSGHGALLDPFAGSGAALLAARDMGWDTHGIELLPVGVKAIKARVTAEEVSVQELYAAIEKFKSNEWRLEANMENSFPHLRITKNAFPVQIEKDLTCFRTYLLAKEICPKVRRLLDIACMSILESVSYTRKDGQYLRWDSRTSRHLKGKPFYKGEILTFDKAMRLQLGKMLEDLAGLDLFSSLTPNIKGEISINEGSCLRLLPEMESSTFDLIVTSPPYCNRYDYTRTYALELAYLGVNEERLKALRQDLLSCTVENRPKVEQLRLQYEEHGVLKLFNDAMNAFTSVEGLHEVMEILDKKAEERELNNNNVPRMVRNYFVEMSLVIFEMARVLRQGGKVVMVNDNVQYAGEEIPVDLILCELAAEAGLVTESLWTLGRGKGNSSQQMGKHGRNELRKCAYVWRKDG